MSKGLLIDALDFLAPAQEDVPTWDEILARAGADNPAPAQRPLWKRSWVIALAVLVAALVPLAAIGAEQGWWFTTGNGGMQSVGPVVEIESGVWDGHPWKMEAERVAETDPFAHPKNDEPNWGEKQYDLCISIDSSASQYGGLGCEPGPPKSGFGGVDTGTLGPNPDETPYVAGAVSEDITQVDIYLPDGHILHTPTIAAPEALGASYRFYAAELPAFNDMSKLVGLDSDGKVIACFNPNGPAKSESACG